jgi:hypothetical protein
MSVATKVLHMAQIDAEKNVKDLLEKHIEALLYNVASLACVLTIASGKTKTELSHIVEMQSLIMSKCSVVKKTHKKITGQHGGTSMPAEYFGYSTGAYAAGNAGNETVVSDIQFGQGLARGAIDSSFNGQSGGSSAGGAAVPWHISKTCRSVNKHIGSVFKNNDVKFSKVAMNELLKVVDIHLTCLGNDLKKHEPLTMSKTIRVLDLKRNAIFR